MRYNESYEYNDEGYDFQRELLVDEGDEKFIIRSTTGSYDNDVDTYVIPLRVADPEDPYVDYTIDGVKYRETWDGYEERKHELTQEDWVAAINEGSWELLLNKVTLSAV